MTKDLRYHGCIVHTLSSVFVQNHEKEMKKTLVNKDWYSQGIAPLGCVICENTRAPHIVLPVVALLACEALEVVDVGARPHHHLEGGDHLLARRAVTRRPEQPAKGRRRKKSEVW